MKFILEKKRTVRWDGSDETAAHFGYGDYVNIKYDFVAEIEAPTEKEARKIARKICKAKDIHCLFGGVGYTVILTEKRNEI